MLDFRLTVDAQTGEDVLDVPLRGMQLIETPLFNKGSAFTGQERRAFGLLGLVPPHVSPWAEQLGRVYGEYLRRPSDLEKHVYLRELQDRNEVLFYRLLSEHITEMMPVVYTPTVGA